MNEVVTLLTSVSGRALVKSFSDPDVTEQPFSIGNLFNVFDESVSDLKSLSRLLYKLENEPTQTIIRGSLAEDKTGPVPRNKDIFIPTSRHWCMIDIDSLPWDGDLQDHKAMLDYASSQLPPEFQQADCWYHFSSSLGLRFTEVSELIGCYWSRSFVTMLFS